MDTCSDVIGGVVTVEVEGVETHAKASAKARGRSMLDCTPSRLEVSKQTNSVCDKLRRVAMAVTSCGRYRHQEVYMSRWVVRSLGACAVAWSLACAGLAPRAPGVGAEREILAVREVPDGCVWIRWSVAGGEQMLGQTARCPRSVVFSPSMDRVVAKQEDDILFASWPSLSEQRTVGFPELRTNSESRYIDVGGLHMSVFVKDQQMIDEIEAKIGDQALPKLPTGMWMEISLRADFDTLTWMLASATIKRPGEGEMEEATTVSSVEGRKPPARPLWLGLGGTFGDEWPGGYSQELSLLFEAGEGVSTALQFVPASTGGWLYADQLNAMDENVGQADPVFDCGDAQCRSRTLLASLHGAQGLSLRAQGDYMISSSQKIASVYQHGYAEPLYTFGPGVRALGWLPVQ